MSIEYEIRDVIKAVLRKWYVILGIALICAVAVTPVCERSYQSAMNNYLEKKTQVNMEPGVDYEGYIYIDEEDSEEMDRLAGDVITIAQRENALGLQFIYYRSIHAIQIVGDNIEKKECELFIENLENEIDRILLSKMDKKVNIRFEGLSDETEITTIGDIIMKEPTRRESGIRVMGTAAIFGALLGLALVLILDYVKSCKKILAVDEAK